VRHLWILRHGKAAADAPAGGGDAQRPLVARGRADATRLGRRLAAGTGAFGLVDVPVPAIALCSAAARTRETADLVLGAMDAGLRLESYRSLYGASTGTVLGYVRELDDAVASALVVGHNPAMFQLAWELVGPVPGVADDAPDGDDPDGDRAVLRSHGFPTCALAVVTLTVDRWEDVDAGRGALAGLFRPPY
jgi:phosphohistidine phosphatase